MRRLLLLAIGSALVLPVTDSSAVKSLPDYRYFRALSIDLVGRPPTRDELADFERADFDLAQWIDTNLSTSEYAARIRRVYMDLLHLELPANLSFAPSSVILRRQAIRGPDGSTIQLHFRYGQRRKLEKIDGDICFTADESGLIVQPNGYGVGTPLPISQQLLDERTVEVKPWWLYSDYRSASPHDRIDASWTAKFPGYDLQLPLFVEATGAPTEAVRVCKEEAQLAETGTVYVSNRPVVSKQAPFPPGRKSRLPPDLNFAKANAGKPISCLSHTGFMVSTDCGCGPGLERCIPNGPNGFVMPQEFPLGIDQPFVAAGRPALGWFRAWWSEEPVRFMDKIFRDDRDVRELLVGKGTSVNGPLAQFYRGIAQTSWTSLPGLELGYGEPEPLFDRKAVPDLIPAQTATWVDVPDRGKHAAGLLTMPAFLVKYGTRRQRAHVVYQAFLCRDFLAASAKLVASDEPDLAKRPGCAACHRTLEPLAAYFTRIQESDWTFLPPAQFPLESTQCATNDPKRMSLPCKTFYDPAFTSPKKSIMRGATGSIPNADAGPAGLGAQIVAKPEFAACVVKNVARSFLGRELSEGDAPWTAALAKTFVGGGFKMRALVRAIVTSAQYRDRARLESP